MTNYGQSSVEKLQTMSNCQTIRKYKSELLAISAKKRLLLDLRIGS
jgi:hypothetical protein